MILRTSQITYSLWVWSTGAMQFEAKHSYFKQLSHSLGNFINLPYSLASRHQHATPVLNTVTNGLPGVTNDVEVGPGN